MRLQEFIELVRAENNLRAIAYARKYLAPWGATHMKELQRVLATLAFRRDTECATYKVSMPSVCVFLCISDTGDSLILLFILVQQVRTCVYL